MYLIKFMVGCQPVDYEYECHLLADSAAERSGLIMDWLFLTLPSSDCKIRLHYGAKAHINYSQKEYPTCQ